MRPITYKATDNQVAIGSNVVYAAAQNFGLGARSSLKSRRRMSALPARRHLVLQDEDLAEMREEVLLETPPLARGRQQHIALKLSRDYKA